MDAIPPEEVANELASNERFMKITLHETGAVSVSGCINDKILAYGMLEYARDAIHAHHEGLLKAAKKKPSFFSNGH